VHDAIMSFAERAAEKVRHSGQVAGAVQLFIRTDPFAQDGPQKSVSGSATFHRPTSDTRELGAAVIRIFERIWLDGYGWRKAGVLLLDLAAPGAAPASLFDVIEAPGDGLMRAIDQINSRYGRGTARLGLAQKDGEWHMRRENLSPSFTTKWTEIPLAKMG
jgi:DNA polymerase V